MDASISPSELPRIYFYDLMNHEHPPMAKETNTQWKDKGVLFTASTFNSEDDAIDKVKISIGYEIKAERILITEIRESWTCHKGSGHIDFSCEQCD